MKIGKKLRVLRKKKKITLGELSEKSGVQIATLSRMENDIMTGTLQSHIAICKVLGVSLSDFYHDIENEYKVVSLAKQNEKYESFVHRKKSTSEMLVTKLAEKKMMPILIRIKKSGKTPKEEDKVGAEKFIYILQGKIRAEIGKEVYNLSKGDSIYFDASLSHVFYSNSPVETRLISILSPPAV